MRAGIIDVCHHNCLHADTGDLNSGFQACMVSTLSTKPLPRPVFSLLTKQVTIVTNESLTSLLTAGGGLWQFHLGQSVCKSCPLRSNDRACAF